MTLRGYVPEEYSRYDDEPPDKGGGDGKDNRDSGKNLEEEIEPICPNQPAKVYVPYRI